MSAIDFCEISPAHKGADRDAFELFVREFLHFLGFQILVGPDRGADAGRDLIVAELRTGIIGETKVKWLVSCKHKAHSGAAVSPTDEANISDRVGTHGCEGFLAVYSTVPSSGLAATLNSPNIAFQVKIFDPATIERELLKSAEGGLLFKRFFPKSFSNWMAQQKPISFAQLFAEKPELNCQYCHKSLIYPEPSGIVVVWASSDEQEERRTENLYWCCKGKCDEKLGKRFGNDGLSDGWEDVSDLLIPTVFIRWIMASLNELHVGRTYSAEAHKNHKQLLLTLFQFVCRSMSEEDRRRMNALMMLPNYVGGFGYDN